MPLTPGSRLGPYAILAPLGAGGMGEVYRAHDTTLNRDIAIKVLPAAFAQDRERVARFRREAQVLASLNHPNVAGIYGLEERDGEVALALEFVDGEDLAERLGRGGAIPADQAVSIARQIAEGLEAAHERGIVHRDLKPANVKLTTGGGVKILDFGLAKAFEGDVSEASAHAPTLTRNMTHAGLILGTAAYMSPEQARGTALDKRTDIWAFGVVLFEMLTGRLLFDGGTVSDIIAGVLRQEIDLAALPLGTPAGLRTLLARCLERDPKQRLRDIGEARVLLSGRLDAPAGPAPAPTGYAGSRWWRLLPWALAAAAIAAGVLVPRRPAATTGSYGSTTQRFTVAGPEKAAGGSYLMDLNEVPVVAPDGKTLVIPLASSEGHALFLRRLDRFELTPVEGGGRRPFFSPDGRSLAFARGQEIWKMDLAERQPSLVGRVSENVWDFNVAAWHPDGRLLIPGARGLWSLPATGGEATLLVPAPKQAKEQFTRVSVLGDGRILLSIEAPESARVEVLSADGTGRRIVASGFDQGTVVDDVLIARHSGQWRATRFDLERLTLVGPPVSLTDVPAQSLLARSLAWIDGERSLLRELVWVSRSGVATPTGIPPGYLSWPRLSPDGTRVAMAVLMDHPNRPRAVAGERRLGVLDFRTRARSGLDGFGEPVWSADGLRVVTSLGGQPYAGLAEQVADGSRPMTTLFTVDGGDAWPTSISRDGEWLVYYGATPVRDTADSDAGHLHPESQHERTEALVAAR